MRVVGRADHHRVDLLLHFVEHLAEVLKLLGFGESFVGFAGPRAINIA